ncbi:hypothetical protein [Streptomyces sp. NEAU-YJ-81]|nr:hypothetical protein [Streptomyces sp. NEAU-YJ-81]MBO3682898.1 hypothetical protein [Streptomyces sp. NEAU-YJ-81]
MTHQGSGLSVPRPAPNVSGYRVLVNGVVDMDATSIQLWSQADEDVTPAG